MIGHWLALVVDCPEPRKLAAFYEALLGMHRVEDEEAWVSIGAASGGEPRIGFQQVSDYRPPAWPDPRDPQQMHLDVEVADLDEAEHRVLALGARLVDSAPLFRVYTDPAGHPFCLALPQQGEHYRTGS
ncbi:VOC family protein [Amycolatopsis sp. NPDC004079]|uniref:VOC family protein n=1 Tax=Amycolatopsis sp. NPDC004079 TaxID=3154549 RepID=UPI0033A428EE